MATLIKNLPYPAVVSKGNRGLNFPLFTEWHALLNLIPDLTIFTPQHTLITYEPTANMGIQQEESPTGSPIFYVIPANPAAPLDNIGLPTDGPLRLL
jgi:hypothetical protein